MDLASQNFFLPAAADLPNSIGAAFAAGADCPGEAIRWMDLVEEDQEQREGILRKLLANGETPPEQGSYVGWLSVAARRAKPALQRSFCLHLLEGVSISRSLFFTPLTCILISAAFFDSCCSQLPVFRAWQQRLPEMIQDVDALDPPTRVSS